MITKKYLVYITLIFVVLINGFSFWRFFSLNKTLSKEIGAEAIDKNIQLINEAKKNINGKIFCTTITENKDIGIGETGESNTLPE